MTLEVDADEALRIARAWATRFHPDATVTLTPFDRGYVVARTAPEIDPARGPVFDVPVRIVVDGRTGAIADFPALPAPVVAQLYRQRCAAEERFSPQLRALLALAGWRPGRDVGPFVDRWWETSAPEDAVLTEAMRAGLAEFGGLTLTMARLTLLPQRGDEPVDVHEAGVRIGTVGPSPLLLDADGGVHRDDGRTPQRLADDLGEALRVLLGG